MKRLLLLLMVVCGGLFNVIQAQITFQSAFGTSNVGNNIPYDIAPTNDGGFILTGFSSAGTNLFQSVLLSKTNDMGVPQWTKIFGGSNFEVGNAIAQTPDNGYIIAGRSLSFGGAFEDAFLTKTDAMGNLQWTKAYGGSHTDMANSVFPTSDGGYTFIGESRSFSPNNDISEVFIVHTSSTGDIVWSKTHSLTFNISRVSGIALPNGGYAFTGMAQFVTAKMTQEVSKDVEIEAMKEKTWLKNVGNAGGDFLHTGIILVELDANGNIVTEKLFTVLDNNTDCFGTSIVRTQDGGYFIGGYTIQPSSTGFNYYATAMKTNGNGDVEWTKNFQTFDSFFNVSCNQVPNTNFTLTVTNSIVPGTNSRIANYFMNPSGTLIEAHEYGNDGLNAPRAVIPNSTGVLIAGQSNGFGGSSSFNPLDTYLIQTDGFGASGCNDTPFTPQQGTFTYSLLIPTFTTETNGTSHVPTVQTENLTPENNPLCSFTPPVTATIEGFVWWDRNKDGIQQPNEGGIGNVNVNLHNATNFSLIANTFTESDGTYTFEVTNTTLDYYVVFGTAPLFTSTTANAGSNQGLNSDVTNSITAGSSNIFSIEADETVEMDAGLLGTGTISGFVWKDDNGDGLFAGETRVNGVDILLTFNNNAFVNIPFTTTTQNDGFYTFDNLLVGEAVIEVTDIQGSIVDGGVLTTANNPTNPFNINMNQLNIENVNFGFQVPVCNIEILSVTPTACNPDNNTYTLDVTVAYQNAPSGNILLTVLGKNTTFTADGSGQQTFTINQLNANGFQNVGVSASFAANPDCSDNLGATYNAPASCNVDCMIDITNINVSDCNLSTNTYSVEVTVAYEGEPTGGINLTILGNTTTFTTDGSGQQTFAINQLDANGFQNIGVSASFVNDPDCKDNLGATYNAPTACDVNCAIEVTGINVGDCNPATNTYNLAVSVTYQDAPNGNLNIEVGGTTYPFNPNGSGQETFNIGLTANGLQNVGVSASFANEANCSDETGVTFDAPVACSAECSIEVTDVSVGNCNPSINSYQLDVTVEYEDAPNGVLNIEVLGTTFSFTPDGSGKEGFSIILPTSEAENVDVTAAFAASPNCSSTLANAYDEPASCVPQCNIDITNISVSDCNEDTNTYILEVTVTYDNSPEGNIVVSLLGDDYSIPSNGSGEETYSIELPAIGIQNVVVTATFDDQPNCSATLVNAYDEPEPCVNDCPSSATATASKTEVCSGETISLKAVINNLNFVLVWTDENGETFDHYNVLLTNETCAPIVRTFTAMVTCTTNSSIKFIDSIDITVYPTDISAFITPVAGGCMGTVSLDPSCGGNVTVKPFEAEAGDSGIGFVILNWVGGGDCINKLTIPVPYDCVALIDAVNDNLGTFPVGQSVTFADSQILSNDTGNNISIAEICASSAKGGTITDNGNGTYTYTPPSPNFIGTDSFCYTITDNNGNIDEATVSLAYGDVKFSADITYTCDTDEGTYTLILTIQGSDTYFVEVVFPEVQNPITMPQGVVGLGPFAIQHPNYSVKITQINTGGSITLDGVVIDCITLPIELVSFEGEVLQDGNLLKWVTASEVNNDFFSLERSIEGTYFETIHTQDGAGTTSLTMTYDYLDRTAPNGISYYRLQQTDFDGSSSTSKVIALQRGESEGGFDIVSVTPLGNFLHTAVGFQVPKVGNVEVKLFDVSARLVYSTSIEAMEGFNVLQMNTESYSQGIYLLQLRYGEEMRTVKILR
ncbi:MAG: SdrD B-like domain-containing protein [Chitinophagales bacterium]